MKQEKYIEKLLDKFNMKSAKSSKTSMEVNLKLEKPTDEKLPDFPYQNLIGSLMYIATATRPDIMYPVSHLSQFNTCFRKEHWIAAKRVLRYLKQTKSQSLVFQKTADPCISG
ncbi:Hypothetical protein NTJ_05080 [Nesidiocoris tenuis]|uniref:Reverse transcriptase Ty1/copia-type domain-containing protein n=1 Tax=Nesidiocoris tenuis TaxID=355587 RepID=A0ABN7APE7_9HEMI|nr:Hypothetical protein NTJ_05080 [Nesidiocoris tenuis]